MLNKLLSPFRSLKTFIQNVILELKLVEWQKFSQVARSTVIVVIMVLFFVLILTSMDNLMVGIRNLLLTKATI